MISIRSKIKYVRWELSNLEVEMGRAKSNKLMSNKIRGYRQILWSKWQFSEWLQLALNFAMITLSFRQIIITRVFTQKFNVAILLCFIYYDLIISFLICFANFHWRTNNLLQVGSLTALHLGKRGYKVDLYEYREGEKEIVSLKHWNKFDFLSKIFEKLN